ncbi:MAG: hypothetical protein ACFE8Z_00525 [Candidatus Hermodarchaeota archaeon]
MRSEQIPGICVAEPDADCDNCSLKDELLCRFEKALADRFLLGNISYRVLATAIALLVGFHSGHWWMAPFYVGFVLLTFLIVEPRLLCSHCPYYAKEGRTLRCWALRGMPKLWKYRPEPASALEKRTMLIFGGIIDLAPIAFALFGFYILALEWLEGSVNLIILTSLVGLTLVFLILAAVFDKMLRGGTCKICTNFSCGMNKVPDDLRKEFLEKNPTMKEAWEKVD